MARDLGRLGREGVAALRTALEDESPEVRAVAAVALLGSDDVDTSDSWRVEVLLQDDDAMVRLAAALALDLRSGAHSRLDWLAFPDADTARIVCLLLSVHRHGVARVLRAHRGHEALVEMLREMLGDDDVREDAMALLGFCGTPEVADDLDPARYERSGDRRNAGLALLRLGCRLEDALSALAGDPDDVWASGDWTDDWEPVLPLLRRSMSRAGPIPPESALRIVRGLGPRATECLPEILRLGESREFLPAVLCALASLGTDAAPAIPWVLETCGDRGHATFWSNDVPEPISTIEDFRYGPQWPFPGTVWFRHVDRPIAVVAFRAAARMAPSDPAVKHVALERLDDPVPEVREAALLALSGWILGPCRVEAAVSGRLARDPDARVRAAAATVLADAARRGIAVPALVRELETGDAGLASRALAMAGQFERLELALASKRVATRTWAAAALFDPQLPRDAARWRHQMLELERESVLRRSRAAAVIEASATDPDPAIRLLAVHVIGCTFDHFGDKREEMLATALDDTDHDVALTARQAVKWSPPSSGPPRDLIEELSRELRDGRPTPVDLVLKGADPSTLRAIARDQELMAFERWSAARASR